MGNVGPVAAEVDSGVGGTPGKFQRVSRLGFVTAPTSLNGGQPNFDDLWPSAGVVHYIYIFGGCCPVTEFCQVQCSLCVQVLRSRILAALLHGTPAAVVSQINFAAWYKEWNYGTFAEGATYIRLGGQHVGHRPKF